MRTDSIYLLILEGSQAMGALLREFLADDDRLWGG